MKNILIFTLLLSTFNAEGQVFLIPHSAIKLGSQETDSKSYEQTIRKIYTSVLESLESSKHTSNNIKKFVFSEVVMIKKFIEEDPKDTSSKIKEIKDLVEKKQLEFVNGGLAEIDSNCNNYEDIIMNWFYGIHFLEKNIGVRPQTLWHIHQYGHSKTSLFIASLFGFKTAVLGGISEKVFKQFEEQKSLQVQLVIDEKSSIQAHLISDYIGPIFISCDKNCDKNKFEKEKLEKEILKTRSKYTNDFFWLLGGNYDWSESKSRFEYLDFVLKEVKELEYSTISDYLSYFDSLKKDIPKYDKELLIYTYGKSTFTGFFGLNSIFKHKVKRLGKLIRSFKNIFSILIFQQKIPIEKRKELSDDFISICSEFGQLIHHNSISGLLSETAEIEYRAIITTIEQRLVQIYSKITSQNSIVCDFNELLEKKESCIEYIKKLNTRKSINFTIINPIFSKISRLFSILIPNNSIAGSYSIKTTDKVLESETICFKGSDFCTVYFQDSLNSCSHSKSYQLVTSFDPIKRLKVIKKIRSTKEKKFKSLLKGEVIVNFTRFSLKLTKSAIVYTSKNDPKLTNTIQFVFTTPKNCQKEIIDYDDEEVFHILEQPVSFSTFKSPIFEGIYVKTNLFEYKLYKKTHEDHLEIELLTNNINQDKNKCQDFYISIDNSLINANEFKFFSDSNGFFDMERKTTGKIQERMYPINSYASIRDSINSLTFFTDRSRSAFVKDNKILMSIDRLIDNKGALKMTARFIIFNYKNTDDSRMIGDKIDNIKSNLDIEIPIFFLHKKSIMKQIKSQLNELNNDIDLPIGMRYNIELINSFLALIRFQNHSFLQEVIICPIMIIKKLFVDCDYFEIDFSIVYQIKNEDKKPVKESYTLKPLEFVSILVEIKNKQSI